MLSVHLVVVVGSPRGFRFYFNANLVVVAEPRARASILNVHLWERRERASILNVHLVVVARSTAKGFRS